MSKLEPSWQLLVPPKCCEKCSKPYSREKFSTRSVDTDIKLTDKEYCTWCKECDSKFMDEREEV